MERVHYGPHVLILLQCGEERQLSRGAEFARPNCPACSVVVVVVVVEGLKPHLFSTSPLPGSPHGEPLLYLFVAPLLEVSSIVLTCGGPHGVSIVADVIASVFLASLRSTAFAAFLNSSL